MMLKDVMTDRTYYRLLPPGGHDTSDQAKWGGLQLKVGVVYKVNKENLTCTIGNNLRQKTPKALLADEPHTVEAMILGQGVGMEMNDLGLERFGAEVTLPQVGSHVVYGQLYGYEGTVQSTVVLGSIFPMHFSYNATAMFDAVKKTFVDLALRKVIQSPTGYYWYETDIGDTVTGFISTDPTGSIVKEAWREVRETTGQFTREIFDAATGLIPVSTFEQTASGKFMMKNLLGSLKHICTELQDILKNVSNGTNWLGNLGAPLVYTLTPTDLPRLVALSTEINALLED